MAKSLRSAAMWHHIIAASLLFCSSGLHAESENKQEASVLPQTVSSLPAVIASNDGCTWMYLSNGRASKACLPSLLMQ